MRLTKVIFSVFLLSWAVNVSAQRLCPDLQGRYICYQKPNPKEGLMEQSNQANSTVYQWSESGQTTTISADGLWRNIPLEPSDPPGTVRRNRNFCFAGQRVYINFTKETKALFKQTLQTEVIEQTLTALSDGMKVETRVFVDGAPTSETNFFCQRRNRN